MKTLRQLLAELQKLPPQALENPVRVGLLDDAGYRCQAELQDISFQGNHTLLEGD